MHAVNYGTETGDPTRYSLPRLWLFGTPRDLYSSGQTKEVLVLHTGRPGLTDSRTGDLRAPHTIIRRFSRNSRHQAALCPPPQQGHWDDGQKSPEKP